MMVLRCLSVFFMCNFYLSKSSGNENGEIKFVSIILEHPKRCMEVIGQQIQVVGVGSLISNGRRGWQWNVIGEEDKEKVFHFCIALRVSTDLLQHSRHLITFFIAIHFEILHGLFLASNFPTFTLAPLNFNDYDILQCSFWPPNLMTN